MKNKKAFKTGYYDRSWLLPFIRHVETDFLLFCSTNQERNLMQFKKKIKNK